MKTFMKLLFFVTFLVVSSNPGPVSAEKSVDSYARKIKVSVDDFNGSLILRSATIDPLKYDPYYIVSTLNPETGTVFHLIYVDYDFTSANASGRRRSPSAAGPGGEYRNFYSARDRDGNHFEIHQAGRGFGGCNTSFCSFDEPFAIVVDDAYMNSKSETGMTLRASSQSGVYLDLSVPANYLKAIQARLASERRKLGIN